MIKELASYVNNAIDFCEKGLCGVINGVAPVVALPSFIGTFRRGKLLFIEEKESYSSFEGAGFGLGIFAGLSLNALILNSAAQEISSGNYNSAIALGITNAIGLGIEVCNYFSKREC